MGSPRAATAADYAQMQPIDAVPQARAATAADYAQMQPMEEVSGAESLARGAAQGVTLDFADEAVGGIKGALGALTGEGNFSDLYKKYRDEYRARDALAQEQHGNLYTGGKIGGAIGTGLVTGGGGLAATVGKSAAMGAADYIGKLREMDNYQAQEMLKDAAVGGAAGAVGYGIGAGLSKAGGLMVKRGVDKMQTAEETVRAAREAALRSAISAEAQTHTPAAYAMDKAAAALNDTAGIFGPAEQAAARQVASNPQVQADWVNSMGNQVRNVSRAVAERPAKQAAIAEAQQALANSPSAAQLASQAPAVAKGIAGGVPGNIAAAFLGGGVGHMVGGPLGAGVGAAMGYAGRAAVKNFANTPQGQAFVGAGLVRLGNAITTNPNFVGGAAAGFARALMQAAQKGPDAVAAAHYTLSQRPEYQAALKDAGVYDSAPDAGVQ